MTKSSSETRNGATMEPEPMFVVSPQLAQTRTKVWKKVLTLFRAMVGNTTAHGFAHLQATSVSSIRVFWTVCILASWSLFAFQIDSLYDTYAAEPTTTIISPNGVPFEVPDIIICNPIPVSATFSQAMFAAERADVMQTMAAYNNILTITGQIYPAGSDAYRLMLINTVTQTMGQGVFSWVLGHPRYQTIIHASMNGETIAYTKFDLILHHEFLNCFRFRPNSIYFQAPIGTITMYLYTDAQSPVRKIAEDAGGVPIAMMSFNGKLVPDKSASMMIYFVERDAYPGLGATYIHTSAGQLTDVKLSMKKFEQLNRRSSPCLESPPTVSVHDDYTKKEVAYTYSREQCIINAIMTFIVDQVGCYPSFMPRYSQYKEVPYCFDLSSVINGTENITHFLKRIELFSKVTARMPTKTIEFIRNCKGQQRCSYVTYETKTTIARWPIPTLYSNVLDKLQAARDAIATVGGLITPGWDDTLAVRNDSAQLDLYIKQNLVKVEISPAESTSVHTREELSYQLLNFVSDIGGQMGLLLGVSALSLAELFSFALDICYVLWRPS